MTDLSGQFGIPVSCVHKIIHKLIKYLHVYLVQKYIHWHTMNDWRLLRGYYPEWQSCCNSGLYTILHNQKPKGYFLFGILT